MNVDVAKALGLSCGCYTIHEGRCRYPDYTVDDLLSWLRERNWWLYELCPDGANFMPTDGVYGFVSHIIDADDGSTDHDRIDVDGPTLLAALEQAVLQVSSGFPQPVE